jgi:hypothetical protein
MSCGDDVLTPACCGRALFAADLRLDPPRPKPFKRAFIEFIRKWKGKDPTKGKVRIWDESAWS